MCQNRNDALSLFNLNHWGVICALLCIKTNYKPFNFWIDVVLDSCLFRVIFRYMILKKVCCRYNASSWNELSSFSRHDINFDILLVVCCWVGVSTLDGIPIHVRAEFFLILNWMCSQKMIFLFLNSLFIGQSIQKLEALWGFLRMQCW